jgi:hypothetical protein
MNVMVGVPYSSNGRLGDEAASLDCDVMISAGSLFRANKGGFQSIGPLVFRLWGRCALDSAGFVAMKQGGYRWDVSEYVDFVRRGWGPRGHSVGVPWKWWSSMDYCCEPEIADDQAEVTRRVQKTAATLGETFEEVDYWRETEGDTDLDDPMPILQGWSVDDYLESIELTEQALKAHGRSWPARIGVGSVCRRHLHHGTHGLLVVLQAIHERLPSGVKLHLFGVKGDVLRALSPELADRIESIDSMAWDFAVRKRVPTGQRTVEVRAKSMRGWVERQRASIRGREVAPITEAPVTLRPASCPQCGFSVKSASLVELTFGSRPRRRVDGSVVRVRQSWCRDCRHGKAA